MATINGTAVNFGFTGTNGITITGISGTLLQSADVSAESERTEVANGTGDHVTHAFFDPHFKATLEWTVTGTSLSNAVVNTALASLLPGAFIVISACASNPDLVATGEVQSGATTKKTNKDSARLSVSIEKRTNITAVAT